MTDHGNSKQREIPEGYQPKAPEGYTGSGKPPTGGSGVRPRPPAVTDMIECISWRRRCSISGARSTAGGC